MPFSEVPTSYFSLSSPLFNGNLVNIYYTSIFTSTSILDALSVYGVQGPYYSLLAQEEVVTIRGQFVVCWTFCLVTIFVFLTGSYVFQTCIKRSTCNRWSVSYSLRATV